MTDEELRGQVDTWVEQAYANGNLDTLAAPEDQQGWDTCTKIIMQLIKQDRERHAREARIDELQDFDVNDWGNDDINTLIDSVTGGYIENRITELSDAEEKAAS